VPGFVIRPDYLLGVLVLVLINQFIHNAEEHTFSDTYLIELIDPTGYSVRSRLFHPLGDKNIAYTL
jgi:hypothetical protein